MTLPIPAFLGPPQPLPQAERRRSFFRFLTQERSGEAEIGFSMLTQEAANWCWAAVTQAVIYHARGGVPPSQTEIVNDHVRRSQPRANCVPDQGPVDGGECEDASCSRPCNGLHKARVALREAGFAVRTLQAKRAVELDQIQHEIGGGRPVVCRIDFGSGGGHFLCVTGWRMHNRIAEVLVHDPRNGRRGGEVSAEYIRYSDLRDNYVAGGNVGRNNFAYGV